MVAVDEGTILSHDLLLLESVEFKQRIKFILEIIEEVKWQDMDPDMLTRCDNFFLIVASSSCFFFFQFLCSRVDP